MKKARTF